MGLGVLDDLFYFSSSFCSARITPSFSIPHTLRDISGAPVSLDRVVFSVFSPARQKGIFGAEERIESLQ